MPRIALTASTLVLLLSNVVWANEGDRTDAVAWLEKIAKAARHLNYTGTFVYQFGAKVESSRISHFTDRSGEYEKLETLDGPRREIIRVNDEIYCYDHDNRVLRRERQTVRRDFPALIPEKLSQVTDFYDVKLGAQERIAGFDTILVTLDPKDNFRYGHRLWADVATGILIKAKRLNDHKEVLEQFTFTQLDIGTPVTRDMTKPSMDVGPAWRRDTVSADTTQSNAGWMVKSFPAGFRKVMEMRRTKEGVSGSITHLVLSDGLASVSIFIEPLALKQRRPPEGVMRHGAVNIMFRSLSDQMITVVGEAPRSTIQQIGNSVSPASQAR